jgi:predicted RNase H-like nuclease (RuvC/YqgF family)
MGKEAIGILNSLLDEKLRLVNARLDKMDGKIDKNTMMLEELKTKVETIAEVQKPCIEQNEMIKPLNEKTDAIELAAKDNSKGIKDLNEKLDKVEKVTMQNTYDIAYLKAIK